MKTRNDEQSGLSAEWNKNERRRASDSQSNIIYIRQEELTNCKFRQTETVIRFELPVINFSNKAAAARANVIRDLSAKFLCIKSTEIDLKAIFVGEKKGSFVELGFALTIPEIYKDQVASPEFQNGAAYFSAKLAAEPGEVVDFPVDEAAKLYVDPRMERIIEELVPIAKAALADLHIEEDTAITSAGWAAPISLSSTIPKNEPVKPESHQTEITGSFVGFNRDKRKAFFVSKDAGRRVRELTYDENLLFAEIYTRSASSAGTCTIEIDEMLVDGVPKSSTLKSIKDDKGRLFP